MAPRYNAALLPLLSTISLSFLVEEFAPMKTKLLALALILVMPLSLSGCTDSDGNGPFYYSDYTSTLSRYFPNPMTSSTYRLNDHRLWEVTYEDFDGSLRALIANLHPSLEEQTTFQKETEGIKTSFFYLTGDYSIFFYDDNTHFTTSYCSGGAWSREYGSSSYTYPLEEGVNVMAALAASRYPQEYHNKKEWQEAPLERKRCIFASFLAQWGIRGKHAETIAYHLGEPAFKEGRYWHYLIAENYYVSLYFDENERCVDYAYVTSYEDWYRKEDYSFVIAH
jgi:hypothetical protein